MKNRNVALTVPRLSPFAFSRGEDCARVRDSHRSAGILPASGESAALAARAELSPRVLVADQRVLLRAADGNQPFVSMFCTCALGTRLKLIASFEVSCY